MRLIGAGGGGSSSSSSTRASVEDPDSLQSHQYAHVLDLVSEGPIVGLIDGLKSIYLDDTPIVSADGNANFSGVSVETRIGSNDQSYIGGFSDVENEVSIGVEVKHGVPITRRVSGELDSCVVTIAVPQMTYQDSETGDLHGSSVSLSIDLSNNGGGFYTVVSDTISGKTTSKYKRSYTISLPAPGPWDVRVTRLTEDSSSASLVNPTWWDSLKEVVESKLCYPNSAMVGVTVDAAQFASIPTRAYHLRGIICQVPSNYDPIARTYSGAWNGTFKPAWTNNPAWVYYDLIFSNRYGLGDLIDSTCIDKWALYSIGQYCDVSVPNGFGGYEPRFTCNTYIQSRADAYQLLTSFVSIFRGMSYWGAGTVVTVADKPADAVALFTNANVIDGSFSYAGSSRKVRHTVALVTWNDPGNGYQQTVEYVEDAEGIEKYGINEIEMVAYGCTSRGQAHRLGKWTLYTERLETEVVTFKTGLEGTCVYPGAIIKIADNLRSGDRIGGRILASTASSVTLDSQVTLGAGPYTLSVVTPEGQVVDKAVANASTTTNVLQVLTPFDQPPQLHAMWILASANLNPQTFRVISVSESEKTQVEVSALEHNPNKYLMVEQDLVFQSPPISTIRTSAPLAPTALKASDTLYLAGPGSVGVKLHFSWEGQSPRYEIQWRQGSDNYKIAESLTASIDIAPVDAGNITLRVRAVDALGRNSEWASLTYSVVGKTAPPSNVSGLSAEFTTNGILVSWDYCSDLDYDHTELSWDASFATLLTAKSGMTHLIGWLGAGANVIYARHVDTSGNVSAVAVSTTIIVQAPAQVSIIRSEVQQNIVTLQWNDAKTTQPILRYYYKTGAAGDSFAACTLYGSTGSDGRSDLIRFAASGGKRVWIVAVDMAGNESTPASLDITVTLPNNFVLSSAWDESWSGTKVNAVLATDGGLLLPISSETWQEHFLSRSWGSVQAQISAGYPLYFEPGQAAGSYSEDHDLGVVYPATKVSAFVQSTTLSGGVTPAIQIYWSDTGSAWNTAGVGSEALATNARYIRVVYSVTASGNDDLVKLSRVHVECTLEQKYETATVNCVSTDTNGTPYTTTKGFYDINTVDCTPADATIDKAYGVISDTGAPATTPVVYILAYKLVAGAWQRATGPVHININGA